MYPTTLEEPGLLLLRIDSPLYFANVQVGRWSIQGPRGKHLRNFRAGRLLCTWQPALRCASQYWQAPPHY